MDRTEELQLIRRAKRGDRDAVAALVSGHRRSLHHFLLRLTRREDLAEDIAQDAFVRVLRHLDRFDERFRFSTWLFTIARRLWINHIQKFRPVSDSETVGNREAARESDPVLERQERRALAEAAVSKALCGLNPRQREIVELFHGRGLPIEEIANRLEIPVGTVKSHLFRGRRRMGELVADEPRFRELATALDLPSTTGTAIPGVLRRSPDWSRRGENASGGTSS